MKKIFIKCSNHFDPIWRRGFKKDFFYNNERYVGEAKLQATAIKDWLNMAKRSALKFDIECSLVLRNYFEEHPEDRALIKHLIKEGKLVLLGAGEIIPDPNMPKGETLARNLMYGFLWAEKELGQLPTVGCANDSFGASAQMPQLFRQVGIKWVTGFGYTYPTKDYWRGLDGSMIYINQNILVKNMRSLDGGTYYRPCPYCHGEGCEQCENSGLNTSFRMGKIPTAEGLDMEKYDTGILYAGGEETLVKHNLPELVLQAGENNDGYEYSFATPADLMAYVQHDLDMVDKPDPERISPEVEGGPNSTGCLASRIRTKQNVRDMENTIDPIEKLSTLLYMNGREYPYEKLTDAWRKIIFSTFHDSITGTHIDPGYEELTETYNAAMAELSEIITDIGKTSVTDDGKTISVFNPSSYEVRDVVKTVINSDKTVLIFDKDRKKVPIFTQEIREGKLYIEFLADLKPLTVTEYTYRQAEVLAEFESEGRDNFMENEYYIVKSDIHGIYSIFDKTEGCELIDASKGYANEIVLENDFGDAWATRDNFDRRRSRLGNSSFLKYVKHFENYSEFFYIVRFTGNEDALNTIDYKVVDFYCEQRVRLYKGVKRVDFRTKIKWDTFDKRVRISFPAKIVCKDDRATYAVPYGSLQRDRYEMSRIGWNNASGDYAGLEWAGTASYKDVNLAVMNKGTPCYRFERGELFLTVLRSPSYPHCLYWGVQNVPVYELMRDQGEHVFDYAIYSFKGEWDKTDVVNTAAQYNNKTLAFCGKFNKALPEILLKANHSVISAFKRTEKEDGLIVRVFENCGASEEVVLCVPGEYKKAYVSNLLEKELEEIPVKDGKIKLAMNKFEFKSIKIKK